MKKLIFILLIMILVYPIRVKAAIANSSGISTIKIYLFSDDNCQDCEKAEKWIKEVQVEDYRIKGEILNIDDNKNINEEVKKVLKIKKSKLPLLIIGSNYFMGFDDEVKDKIMKAIDAYEKESKYCDLVTKIENKEDTKECLEENKGIYEEINHKSYGYLIIILILISGGCLIVLKKKNIIK